MLQQGSQPYQCKVRELNCRRTRLVWLMVDRKIEGLGFKYSGFQGKKNKDEFIVV